MLNTAELRILTEDEVMSVEEWSLGELLGARNESLYTSSQLMKQFNFFLTSTHLLLGEESNICILLGRLKKISQWGKVKSWQGTIKDMEVNGKQEKSQHTFAKGRLYQPYMIATFD